MKTKIVFRISVISLVCIFLIGSIYWHWYKQKNTLEECKPPVTFYPLKIPAIKKTNFPIDSEG